MKAYAVIVAGGTGSRMKSATPKQFALLAGKPVLMHTIEAFSRSDFRPDIIVALHADLHATWNDLCLQHTFDVHHRVVSGGATRYDSVKRALAVIDEQGVVAIHDAVRPLVSNAVIAAAYETAIDTGSAVAAIPSRDSVRQKNAETGDSRALPRDEIYLVQTPQTFRTELLAACYEQTYQPFFTDDASVVEAAGHRITLVDGEATNLKITFPEDLALAAVLLKQKNPAE